VRGAPEGIRTPNLLMCLDCPCGSAIVRYCTAPQHNSRLDIHRDPGRRTGLSDPDGKIEPCIQGPDGPVYGGTQPRACAGNWDPNSGTWVSGGNLSALTDV
jgi:hypothetical protein